MKKNDIVKLVIATVVIIGCIVFAMFYLFPSKKQNQNQVSISQQEQTRIPNKIDETVFKTIATLSDYGKPNLDNIGKSDLLIFGAGSFVPASNSTPAASTEGTSQSGNQTSGQAPPPLVCTYTTNDQGKPMLPEACNGIDDGRTISQ